MPFGSNRILRARSRYLGSPLSKQPPCNTSCQSKSEVVECLVSYPGEHIYPERCWSALMNFFMNTYLDQYTWSGMALSIASRIFTHFGCWIPGCWEIMDRVPIKYATGPWLLDSSNDPRSGVRRFARKLPYTAHSRFTPEYPFSHRSSWYGFLFWAQLKPANLTLSCQSMLGNLLWGKIFFKSESQHPYPWRTRSTLYRLPQRNVVSEVQTLSKQLLKLYALEHF